MVHALGIGRALQKLIPVKIDVADIQHVVDDVLYLVDGIC